MDTQVKRGKVRPKRTSKESITTNIEHLNFGEDLI